MMRAIRSLQYHWRTGGLFSVGRGFLRRAAQLCYRRVDLLAYRCDTLQPTGPLPPDIQVRMMTFGDLLAAGFEKAIAYPEDVRNRLRRGDHCLGITVEGRLAHVAWLSVNRLPIDPGVPDIIAPGLGGGYDQYTIPEFRGRGVHKIALRATCALALQLRLDRVAATIHADNLASRRSHEATGFVNRGMITFRRTLWVSRLKHPPL